MLPDGRDTTKDSGSHSIMEHFGDIDVNDLPSSVFACDIPNEVFSHDEVKAEFEDLFSQLNPTNFIYLQNFRRVRVYFESPLDATQARISLHEYEFRNQAIKIFFAQVETASEGETSDSLLPPQPDKLFLISPPASPPVGWEPIPESEPVIDYGLLSAITSLEPGGSHEIHPGTRSTPSVVVHTCDEQEYPSTQPKLKIQQTRRPTLQS